MSDGTKWDVFPQRPLGSASVITNQSGILVEQTKYYKWGKISVADTSSKFLYTGQKNDPNIPIVDIELISFLKF